MNEPVAATRIPIVAVIIVLVAALVLVPLAGGLFVIQHAQRAMERSVEQGQLATARSVASEVEQGLKNATASVRSLAHLSSLLDAVSEGDVDRAAEILRSIRNIDDAISALVVESLDGRTLVADPPNASIEAATDTGSAISDARAVGDDARFTVREPVSREGSRDAVAVLFGDVSLNEAAPSVTRTRFGQTGSATIVRRDGEVVLAGDPQRAAGATPAPAVRRATADGEGRTFRYYSTLLRRNEVASSAPVQGQPWMVIISQSTDEAFASVARLRGSLIALEIVTLTAGLYLTMWVIRTMRTRDEHMRARMAEQDRLNTALEQFASRAAHDLRNPLATIRMAVDMLGREDVNDMQRTATDIIQRQSGRALELIDGLLALAKATGTPKLAVVELKPLVERIAEHADVETTVEQDGAVIADPLALQQVVANLIENASRYAKSGDKAEVTVARTEQADGWIVSVSDRGPGVPEREVARIFRAFERGSEASGAGTGLGLAIVGAVAEAHGGRAWYEAREGGGSTFSVFLPRPLEFEQAPRNGDAG